MSISWAQSKLVSQSDHLRSLCSNNPSDSILRMEGLAKLSRLACYLDNGHRLPYPSHIEENGREIPGSKRDSAGNPYSTGSTSKAELPSLNSDIEQMRTSEIDCDVDRACER